MWYCVKLDISYYELLQIGWGVCSFWYWILILFLLWRFYYGDFYCLCNLVIEWNCYCCICHMLVILMWCSLCLVFNMLLSDWPFQVIMIGVLFLWCKYEFMLLIVRVEYLDVKLSSSSFSNVFIFSSLLWKFFDMVLIVFFSCSFVIVDIDLESFESTEGFPLIFIVLALKCALEMAAEVRIVSNLLMVVNSKSSITRLVFSIVAYLVPILRLLLVKGVKIKE